MKYLILLFVLFSTIVLSEVKVPESYEGNPKLAPSTLPIICGHPDYVHAFILRRGFQLENASLGRAGAVPSGQPVMMVTHYSKENQIVATVDIPNGQSTCIMYHTFDRTTLGE